MKIPFILNQGQALFFNFTDIAKGQGKALEHRHIGQTQNNHRHQNLKNGKTMSVLKYHLYLSSSPFSQTRAEILSPGPGTSDEGYLPHHHR